MEKFLITFHLSNGETRTTSIDAKSFVDAKMKIEKQFIEQKNTPLILFSDVYHSNRMFEIQKNHIIFIDYQIYEIDYWLLKMGDKYYIGDMIGISNGVTSIHNREAYIRQGYLFIKDQAIAFPFECSETATLKAKSIGPEVEISSKINITYSGFRAIKRKNDNFKREIGI